MRTIINWKNETEPFEPNSLGKGWEKLLAKLYDDLVLLGWDTVLLQHKEKFGGLRFYIGNGNDEIFNRINEAEAESLKTCQWCGKPGHPRDGGWILTLCDECAKK